MFDFVIKIYRKIAENSYCDPSKNKAKYYSNIKYNSSNIHTQYMNATIYNWPEITYSNAQNIGFKIFHIGEIFIRFDSQAEKKKKIH